MVRMPKQDAACAKRSFPSLLAWPVSPRCPSRAIFSEGPPHKSDTRRFKIQLDARLNILHHTGERQAMECADICFNVCIAAVLLIFAPAKSPQRDVQL